MYFYRSPNIEDFRDLQSSPVANVMHNPWNSSGTSNIQNRVGLLCKACTNTQRHTHWLKCPKWVTFSLRITLGCKHLPWKIIMQQIPSRKFLCKGRKTKFSAEYITPKLSAVEWFIELAHSDRMSVQLHTPLILFCSHGLLFDRDSAFSLSFLPYHNTLQRDAEGLDSNRK